MPEPTKQRLRDAATTSIEVYAGPQQLSIETRQFHGRESAREELSRVQRRPMPESIAAVPRPISDRLARDETRRNVSSMYMKCCRRHAPFLCGIADSHGSPPPDSNLRSCNRATPNGQVW